MSLPGAILIARIMIPGGAQTEAVAAPEFRYRSSMDAIARGTEDGLRLWLGIVAMLLVIVALVALADIILGHLPDFCGRADHRWSASSAGSSRPWCGCSAFRGSKAATAGSLMGQKIVLNEFVAYLKLAALPTGALDPRSRLIMLYAMCGFANFGSVGIMIAGVGAWCRSAATRSCRWPCARCCPARWRAG